MDIKTVKKELPAIKGHVLSTVYTCRVTGRMNPQATVSPCMRMERTRVKSVMGQCYHIPWEIVAYHATTDISLDLEQYPKA